MLRRPLLLLAAVLALGYGALYGGLRLLTGHRPGAPLPEDPRGAAPVEAEAAPTVPAARMLPTRVVLGVLGAAGGLYGVVELLRTASSSHPVALLVWLAGAVVLHDGVLAPLTLLVGFLLTRWVPSRARAHLQGALVAGALVTAYTLPLAYRRGTVTEVKALTQQDYVAHLSLVLAVIAVGALVLYVVRVLGDHRRDRAPAAAQAGSGASRGGSRGE